MATYYNGLEKSAEERKSKSFFKPSRFEISERAIKIIASVCMLLYVIGTVVIEGGILKINAMDTSALNDALASDSKLMAQASVAAVFQFIGGFSVPLFAFILVEGFLETGSFKKYFLTILLLAFVTEIPYDFAKSGETFYAYSQNPMWGVVISLIMIFAIRKVYKKEKIATGLGCIFIVVAAVLWDILLATEFGIIFTLLVLVYYLFREKRNKGILVAALVCIVVGLGGSAIGFNGLLYIPGALAAYPIFLYSGKRGFEDGNYKYIFYVIVPVMYLACGFIAKAF